MTKHDICLNYVALPSGNCAYAVQENINCGICELFMVSIDDELELKKKKKYGTKKTGLKDWEIWLTEHYDIDDPVVRLIVKNAWKAASEFQKREFYKH